MTNNQETDKEIKTVKNLNQLRDALAEELRKVASGEINASSANAVANIAGKIISSVKLEMEYHKLSGVQSSIDFVSNNVKRIENTNNMKQTENTK